MGDLAKGTENLSNPLACRFLSFSDPVLLSLRGEIFVLLGRNGAGKSTTLHLLTGIHHPDSGHVEILGKSGSELRKILPKIGVLTENQNYFDDLSPLEHLQFFSKLKRDR